MGRSLLRPYDSLLPPGWKSAAADGSWRRWHLPEIASLQFRQERKWLGGLASLYGQAWLGGLASLYGQAWLGGLASLYGQACSF